MNTRVMARKTVLNLKRRFKGRKVASENPKAGDAYRPNMPQTKCLQKLAKC